MDEFGSDGYLTFFGILEILADEFDVEKPGEVTLSWRYLRRKLRLSTQKLKKILKYCEDSGIFIVSIRERDVNIKSLKFSDICDEYTQRIIRKEATTSVGILSGQYRDNVRVEVEEEAEGEKEEKNNTKKEVDYSQLQKNTDHLCKTLSGYFKKFNFYAWRQEQINKQRHAEGIEECLSLLWKNKGTVLNVRAYLTQLMKIKGPNAFEREAVAEHGKRKKEELSRVKL